LQDNRAVFRIFIALLRFLFNSPSYISYYFINFAICVPIEMSICHKKYMMRRNHQNAYLEGMMRVSALVTVSPHPQGRHH
jgi:hypothetical protein